MSKTKKWLQYQKYPVCNNRYISRCSSKIHFHHFLGIYLFSKVEDNRRLSGSNGNLLSITIVGNTPIARHIIFLVTIPILDFVMIPISFEYHLPVVG